LYDSLDAQKIRQRLTHTVMKRFIWLIALSLTTIHVAAHAQTIGQAGAKQKLGVAISAPNFTQLQREAMMSRMQWKLNEGGIEIDRSQGGSDNPYLHVLITPAQNGSPVFSSSSRRQSGVNTSDNHRMYNIYLAVTGNGRSGFIDRTVAKDLTDHNITSTTGLSNIIWSITSNGMMGDDIAISDQIVQLFQGSFIFPEKQNATAPEKK
jgi:hypothetical protein